MTPGNGLQVCDAEVAVVELLQDTLLQGQRDDHPRAPQYAVVLCGEFCLTVVVGLQGVGNLGRPSAPCVPEHPAQDGVSLRSVLELTSSSGECLNLPDVEGVGLLVRRLQICADWKSRQPICIPVGLGGLVLDGVVIR